MDKVYWPMAEAPAAHAVDSPPDWAHIALDVLCPRCEYNLRTLTRPRCPECGLTFVWSDVLLAAEGRADVQLFEYQWRRRPVRSLIRTTALLLLPWRFWRRLPLAAAPRLGAIAVQFFVVLASCTLFTSLCAVGSAYADMSRYGAFFRGVSIHQLLIAAAKMSILELPKFLFLIAMIAAFTWAGIRLFWQTLGRHRIKKGIVPRVIVYSVMAMMLYWCVVYNAFAVLGDYVGYSKRAGVGGLAFYLRGVLPTQAAGTCATIVLWLSVACGLHIHLRLRHAVYTTLLVAALEIVVIAFVAIQAAVYSSSYNNPVTETLESLLFPFWRYL